ncbi:hypothetical protein EOD41_14835 [Mucilaginibacter limnophilus]|uniref:Plasmid transfer protein n=1 Tax=Mucilaginibacter limnophilus TaxID=1932778 RepID=A0A3S2Y1Q2_9SPHI|nr:hypothetical protein [Mucilaginibacter limnophilus]RVT99718.1 hypothetical protein EOD41_14835 [Mucilaginibacter limnophilus]
MKRILIVLLLASSCAAFAQRVVFDRGHFTAVNENAVVRQAAELTHKQYLEKINDNLKTINVNVGTVALAQTMIYEALSNVNSALKNGLAFRQLGSLVADITHYSDQATTLARSDPALLLFAQDMGSEIRARATRLVTDVSAVILKQGGNMLADFNARDQLMQEVIKELRIISALAYGAWKAMFWAKQRGIIASLNPFAAYINTDKQMVSDIIRNAKYLHQ